MSVGLLAVSFGPSYTYVLLRLVYGQKWSDTEAPKALAYYCGYITLLALNGCTEAYVNAVADPRYLPLSIPQQSAVPGVVARTVKVLQCPASFTYEDVSNKMPRCALHMVSTRHFLAC